MIRTTNRDAGIAIAHRERFTTGTGSLTGHNGPYWDMGYLPDEWRDAYVMYRDEIDYTVVSYGTPIGWHHKDGTWTIPDVRYSSTTSRHQGILRRAVA